MPRKLKADATDALILGRLEANARESAATIAKHVGISERTVRNRISWLEANEIILGYHAVLGGGLDGSAALEILEITIANAEPDSVARFLDGLCAMPTVMCVDQMDTFEFVVRVRHDNTRPVIAALALSAGVTLALLRTRSVLRTLPRAQPQSRARQSMGPRS